MCSPDFFEVIYSINPWMTGEKVSKENALLQWNTLKNEIEKAGGNVKTIKPIRGLPDMVFTANSGVTFKNKFVTANMKFSERVEESKHFKKWFSDNGYEILDLPKDISLEGCGDVIICGDNIIGGYGFRSDLLGLEITAGMLNLNLIALQLQNPAYYHLDTCLCMLNEFVGIYYPGAFLDSDITKLKKKIKLIPVSKNDAEKFVCNSMMVGNTLLTSCDDISIEKQILKYGIEIIHVQMSEFLKSGGGIQCLSLSI